jgi:peptide/nickel transport system substrate-binding protein
MIRPQKGSLSLLVSVLAASLFLNSCNNYNSNTSANKSDPDVLKLLYWQAPTILNPHLSNGFKDAEASRITLEPLASFDEKGQLIPFLAAEIPTLENGGVAKDGKSVTWKLRKDVKWSDGKPFTAKDVIFTYQFVTNPKVAAITAGTYEVIKDIQKIDDYTIKVNFKDINPAWYLVFVGNEGAILPEHLLAKYNGENSREAPTNQIPVGTGAYKVTQFKPGDIVIYEPSEYYRDPKAINFKKIELKGGGDATSAARAVMQTGDVDYAYNLQVEANILQELETGGKGKAVAQFSSLSEQLFVNLSDPNKVTNGERSNLNNPHPFLSEIKVRQALGLAIDRETISKQLYGTSGKATANMLVEPPEYNSSNTSYEFNLEKAGKLLDEAGWKDSNGNGIRDKNGVEMKIVFQTSVNTLRQKTQEIIKQSLQTLGIEVELKTIDPSIFFSSDVANDDTVEKFYADLQMFTTGNLSPDPSAYLKGYICKEIPQKKNSWAGNNYVRYCNPEYDKLWQIANRELDTAKRQKLFIQMNDMLVKDAIVIPLIHRADVVGVGNGLQNVSLSPWDLKTWQIVRWKK